MKRSLFLVLGMLVFVVFMFGVVSAETEIGSCQNLTVESEVYILNQSITDIVGTCFNITANNVTLNGNGFNISGDDSGTDYGIYIDRYDNLTVENFGNIADFVIAIFLSGSNSSTIQNNTLVSNFSEDHTKVIYLKNSRDSSVYGNYIEWNATGIGKNAYGVYFEVTGGSTSTNNNIYNNIIYLNSLASAYGVYISSLGYTNENVFDNNSIDIISTSGNGLYFLNLVSTIDSNEIKNNNISLNCPSLSDGIGLGHAGGSSMNNNVFLNNNLSILGNPSSKTINEIGSGSGVNYLIYNNSFGEIKWVKTDLDVATNLTFPGNIEIGEGWAYYNASGNSSIDNLNSSANITFYSHNLMEIIIYRNDVECNATTAPSCYNLTSASTNPFIFNVSSWSNYSIEGTSILPDITTQIINSSAANNFSNEDLQCYATGEDIESSNLTVYYRWYLNDSLNLTGSLENITNGTLTLISTLESGNTSVGDIWKCSVLVNDGTSNSTFWENSSNLTIVAGCGDGISNNGETCSSCEADVGVCSSSGSGSSSAPTFSLTSSQLIKGFQRRMYNNWGIDFKISNENHNLKIEKIENSSVRIKISSDPIYVTLAENESKKVDVDADGYYDILLKNERIVYSSRFFDLFIQVINESVINLETANETMDFSGEEGVDDNGKLISEISIYPWICIGVGILLLVIVTIVYYLYFRRH
jgi:hypothetical protein